MNAALPVPLVMLLLFAGWMGIDAATAQAPLAPSWVQRVSGGQAAAMAVDRNGNVIVTGAAGEGGAADYLTIKYSAEGLALWTNRFDGPAGGEDAVRGVTLDRDGNIFVSGNSSVLPASSSFTEIVTIAYASDGTARWTNRFGGGTVTALTTDGAGDLYLGGYFGAGSGSDYMVLKFSNAGALRWTRRYDGPAQGVDIAAALAVDDGGTAWITGFSVGSNGLYGYLTLRYSSDGTLLWERRYDPAGGPGLATALALDGRGNVVVTGYASSDQSSHYQYATIAYSDTGAPRWTNRFAGPTQYDDRAAAVALDADGNVLVTGTSYGLDDLDYATIKCSSSGIPLWTNRYSGPGALFFPANDQATALAVDRSGNVVVTGVSVSTNGFPDFVTIGYANAGVALWTNRFNGTANGPDSPSSLAIGRDGAVYVSGASDGDPRSRVAYDFVTVKYRSSPSLGVALQLELAGEDAVLRWTNAAFRLQSALAPFGSFTNIPGATSPYIHRMESSTAYFRLKAENP